MPIKVAIADDSPTIRRVVRSFIESHTDWKVCSEAENGFAAIAEAERLNPDLIVLDFSMPGKNGLEVARAVADICPNSAMVLFTAHASSQLSIEAQSAGIKAVIPKDGVAALEQLVGVLRQITALRPA